MPWTTRWSRISRLDFLDITRTLRRSSRDIPPHSGRDDRPPLSVPPPPTPGSGDLTNSIQNFHLLRWRSERSRALVHKRNVGLSRRDCWTHQKNKRRWFLDYSRLTWGVHAGECARDGETAQPPPAGRSGKHRVRRRNLLGLRIIRMCPLQAMQQSGPPLRDGLGGGKVRPHSKTLVTRGDGSETRAEAS